MRAIWIALRILGTLVMGVGFWLLAREQRITVGADRPARPRFIVLWVAVAFAGIGISVLSVLAE